MGSKEAPCPTLNLEEVKDCECKGIAFEFTDTSETAVRECLAEREGTGFPLKEVTIRPEDDTEVTAHTPIYKGKNLVVLDEAEKARMIARASGANGSCRSYIKRIAELLARLGIEDAGVSPLWQAVQKTFFESTMSEIRDRLKLLESALPRRMDGYALSPDSKLPMKALVYREVLIWRMVELSRSALENLENENLSSAVTLIRAALETTAGLWYLRTKLHTAVTTKSKDGVDDYLMKLLMGTRTIQELPQPMNVLNFVDRVNKDIEGFREQYDNLSEFAHPNWAGTSLLYSKSDPKNLWTDFGKNMRGLNSTRQAGASNLSVALMIFERTYNTVADLMPAFVNLCSTSGKAAAPETT
ncbi:MAG TPA: gamma-glutamylcyclotransferase [Candidatus Angelobacter sp.]